MRKVCAVTGQDRRGLPLQVIIEGESVVEAAAKALEMILEQDGRRGDLRVSVLEPGKSYTVQLGAIEKWIQKRGTSDTIGVTALKSRLSKLMDSGKGAIG